jgi:hypothetical protein
VADSDANHSDRGIDTWSWTTLQRSFSRCRTNVARPRWLIRFPFRKTICAFQVVAAQAICPVKIVVPPGVQHRTAYSKRSDKFYYVLAGEVEFTVDGNTHIAGQGDVCIIRKEQKFSYLNEGKTEAELILVHTPAFQLEAEVFVE